jgi:hypothetical protein
MEFKRIEDEINRLEAYAMNDIISNKGLEMLSELKQALQLLQTDVIKSVCEHKNRTQHFSDVFGCYESCNDCKLDL